MKLKEWASVAEIVGSIAVVITLVVLVVEIRENTDETRAANRQSVIDDLREQLLVRAGSPSLAAAIAIGTSDTDLTPQQYSQYLAYLVAVIKSVEEAFFQYTDGRLEKEYLDTRVAGLVYNFLDNPNGRDFYERIKARGELTEAFAQMMDKRLAELDAE